MNVQSNRASTLTEDGGLFLICIRLFSEKATSASEKFQIKIRLCRMYMCTSLCCFSRDLSWHIVYVYTHLILNSELLVIRRLPTHSLQCFELKMTWVNCFVCRFSAYCNVNCAQHTMMYFIAS